MLSTSLGILLDLGSHAAYLDSCRTPQWVVGWVGEGVTNHLIILSTLLLSSLFIDLGKSDQTESVPELVFTLFAVFLFLT